ncbi:MAG: glycine betaine ABC transporter substrate-binding protein [Oscillospiraceae bacterium]
MKKTVSILICLAIIIVCLTGCGSTGDKLVVIDSRVAEGKIILQMAKMMIEKDTDISVEIKDSMTAVNSYTEILEGRADMMMSYDGTLLTTLLHADPSEVPEGMTLYDYANKLALEKDGTELLAKVGLDNTYALAVTEAVMEKYKLKTISDLAKISGDLVFGAEHEFFDDEGSMKFKPFCEFYGINFKDSKSVDLNLKYAAVESENLDVTVVYATDGLNIKAGLKILEDDKQFFPEYNGALLVKDDIFDRFKESAPNLEEILDRLSGRFTNESMTKLSYAVDVEGKEPRDIAKQTLTEWGLL